MKKIRIKREVYYFIIKDRKRYNKDRYYEGERKLWRLIPFRVGGWGSVIDKKKIYRINWIWENIDFKNYYIED